MIVSPPDLSRTCPALTVVIPTYNRQPMLAECLETICSTRVDCEIVVVDDGSTDTTQQFMERIAASDARVKYYRQPKNRGAGAAVDVGLARSHGRYLAHIADDDSVLPGNFEKKVALLDAFPDIGLVYSLSYVKYEHQAEPIVYRRPEYLRYSYVGGRNEFLDLISGNYVGGTSVVYRRELRERLGGYDPSLPEMLTDWDLWLRLAFHAPTAYINEPLVISRIHAGGMSQRKHVEMAVAMIPVWRKWLVDTERPPILDERIWARMHDVYAMMLQSCYGEDKDHINEGEALFSTLKRDYLATVSLCGARTLRTIQSAEHVRLHDTPTLTLLCSGQIWERTDSSADLRTLTSAISDEELPVRLEEVYLGGDRLEVGQFPSPALEEALWQPVPSDTQYIQLWHTPAPYFRADPNAHAVLGRTSWGTATLPQAWVEPCRQVDGVLVPSASAATAFERSGVPKNKLHVLPSCVDTLAFGPAAPIGNLQTGRSFNFLVFLEWTPLFAWEALLEAWIEEFEPGEDVALMLVIQSSAGLSPDAIRSSIQQFASAAFGTRPMALISLNFGYVSAAQLPSLYRGVDAYVNINRADPWGARILQAMSSELPVVTLDSGVQADMVDNSTGFPVQIESVPVADAAAFALPEYRGQHWAEPVRSSLRTQLRSLFADRQESSRRGKQARQRVMEFHSPAVSRHTLLELLSNL